ncbi:MAG TPA: DUF1425 domain-containing protein [Planctomycetota bacterium]|nr:DUF1425 domain-containing protein [Planctomycetota bacterium]
MTYLRLTTLLALLAFAAAAGCSQTKTVIAQGPMTQSVQFIGVPSSLTVVQQNGEKDEAGDLKRIQAQIRNESNRSKAWQLEYKVQFFNADGREVTSTAKGWVMLTIGRGELATLNGSTTQPGAVRATVTVREFDPKQ